MTRQAARLPLALLLLALAIFGLPLALDSWRSRPLLAIDPDTVAGIAIRAQDRGVQLARHGTGWRLESDAGLPVDEARIVRLLASLAAQAGPPAPDAVPRLTLTLTDDRGAPIARIAVAPGQARLLPAGPWLALPDLPALPPWPSAWMDIAVPRLADAVVDGVRPGASGGQRLPAAELAAAIAILDGLALPDAEGANRWQWDAARQLVLRLSDGTLLTMEQLADPAGGYRLRLHAVGHPGLAGLAFHVNAPLP